MQNPWPPVSKSWPLYCMVKDHNTSTLEWNIIWQQSWFLQNVFGKTNEQYNIICRRQGCLRFMKAQNNERNWHSHVSPPKYMLTNRLSLFPVQRVNKRSVWVQIQVRAQREPKFTLSYIWSTPPLQFESNWFHTMAVFCQAVCLVKDSESSNELQLAVMTRWLLTILLLYV